MKSQQDTAQAKVLKLSEEPVIALNLRYFYGTEADNTTFYMTPKLLFRNKALSTLSSDAKILYILLLDRMKLSAMNGLKEKDGRLFVFYTIEEACYELHKTNNTVGKAFSELDSTKGIGLIERCKRGQGKADKIYVKSVASLPADYPTFSEKRKAEAKGLLSESTESTEISAQTVTYKSQQEVNSSIVTTENYQPPVLPPKLAEPQFIENDEDFTAHNVDNFSSIQNLHLQERNNCISRNEEIAFLETQKLHGNNTDVTNNKIKETDLLKPTFLPNPHATYPHPLSKEVLLERWGEGWEDMDKEMKYYAISSLFENLKAFGDLNTSRKELDRLFYQMREKKEYMEIALDVLLSMAAKEQESLHYEELSRERFEYDTLVLFRQALLQLLMGDVTSTKKYGAIKYHQVIEALIPQVDYNYGYYGLVQLGDIVDCTIKNYIDSSNASETPIKHKIPYMQATIWTTLQEGCIRKQADFGRFAVSTGIWQS